jgi:26S proteasome regulatory subunit T2
VDVMSFFNQDRLEPGCSVLLHKKAMGIVGILGDDTDPMVSVMQSTKRLRNRMRTSGGSRRKYKR